MMYVKEYLNDGANWQAQMVLAYVRAHANQAVEKSYNDEIHDYCINICVGRYENCREQGYVFSIVGISHGKHVQKNYAVYEHRNSDALCVLISTKSTFGKTPSVEDMWADKPENASKYDVDETFSCGDALACGEFIIDDIYGTIEDWLKDK